MGRLTGLGSFLLVTGAVLLVLRMLHLGVPVLFPATRPGPVALQTLDEVERRAGFVPLVPGYRPATLGDRPESLTVTLRPHPALAIVWRGERFLTLTERQGGPMPDHPPTSRPLADVPDARWWSDGATHHMLLRRGDLWLSVETDLPSRDLRRLADTLRPYRP